MDSIKLSFDGRLRGRIVLPASKSISARALIINALSGNTNLPENLSDSDDTQAMLRALENTRPTPSRPTPNPSLVGRGEVTDRAVEGSNVTTPLPTKEGLGVGLDIGAAGTAMRFLTAYLSVTPGTRTITGTERMKHRPIGILVDALRTLGADITYEGEEGFPPLRIVGHDDLEGGSLTVAGNVSSQYISALLMIAPTLKKGLRLTLTGQIASRPYIDMTMSMMRDFGAQVEWEASPRGGLEGSVIEVKPWAYRQRPYHIESDWSAASYWYEMVALSRPEADAEVELVGLHRDSIQGDSKVWKMMEELGVETEFCKSDKSDRSDKSDTSDTSEFIRLRKTDSVTRYFCQDFTHQPDLAQTFAVTCATLGVPFRLVGLQSLRIKETDRIAALEKELKKFADVEVVGDELKTPDPSQPPLKGKEFSPVEGELERVLGDLEVLSFDTYDDHRMAMALAPVCLRTDGEIQINDPKVVSKSYPAYWDDLQKVGFRLIPSRPTPSRPTPSPSLAGRGEVTDRAVEGSNVTTPLPTREGSGEGLAWCCGQHEVCERDILRTSTVQETDYYEDEELDRFRGRTAFSEEEVEEFREVLYTMRPDEVASWVRSLERRQVPLPEELKDEVLLIVRENEA